MENLQHPCAETCSGYRQAAEEATRELRKEFGQKEELLGCARINFENLERARPDVASDPYYRIAKAQLDEALGGMPIEERFALDVKRAEKRK